MSVSTVKNPSVLSNAKTYIIPVLIVAIGIMIAMGNMFSSQAASVPSTVHSATSSTIAAPVVYHETGSVRGGALK
jgi:hypothetical protein